MCKVIVGGRVLLGRLNINERKKERIILFTSVPYKVSVVGGGLGSADPGKMATWPADDWPSCCSNSAAAAIAAPAAPAALATPAVPHNIVPPAGSETTVVLVGAGVPIVGRGELLVVAPGRVGAATTAGTPVVIIGIAKFL